MKCDGTYCRKKAKQHSLETCVCECHESYHKEVAEFGE